jgi:hypothetical protein
MSKERKQLVITHHAVLRYQQRVNGTISHASAFHVLEEIVQKGTASPRPRGWTRVGNYRPGTRFFYSAMHPGVCLLVHGGAVLTVYSRSVCRQWKATAPAPRRSQRPISPRIPKPPGQWRGFAPEEFA